ncbi:MAG: sensor histidine kinase [Clostridia bacterium]|nr:sensor histidine kinase [Clostridia bacterium]
MERIVLDSSLTSTKPSYSRFAGIQQQIISTADSDISVYVNIETRLGLSFLFCISTLPYLAENHQKNIHIFCNTKSRQLFYYGGYIPEEARDQEDLDIAPYLKNSARVIKDVNDVLTLVTEIKKDAPVQMSEKVAEIFTSRVGEMYNNSIEHSGGEYVIGAKFFKNQKNKYCFSCYDTGVGIPQKVISNIDSSFTDREALAWALKRGNSTANKSTGVFVPRGLGLDMLRGFARANDGTIRLCSGNTLYVYNSKKGEQFFELNNSFCGTLFEMDIVADNQHIYILK